jgi:hypothetical protein
VTDWPAPSLGTDHCSGCGRPIMGHEDGRCGWCRQKDRGDNYLAFHDSGDPECFCCELAAAAAARSNRCLGCGAPATGSVAGDRLCDACQPIALRHLAKGRRPPWHDPERRAA